MEVSQWTYSKMSTFYLSLRYIISWPGEGRLLWIGWGLTLLTHEHFVNGDRFWDGYLVSLTVHHIMMKCLKFGRSPSFLFLWELGKRGTFSFRCIFVKNFIEGILFFFYLSNMLAFFRRCNFQLWCSSFYFLSFSFFIHYISYLTI